MSTAAKKQIEMERRAKLMREKPYVMDKIFKYPELRAQGKSTAIIDFCYDYKCNMNCTHCCNLSFAKKERQLSLADVRDFFEQADALGLAQCCISGGEPLFFDDLDDVVKAVNPEKFHIAMSTNGLLLNRDMAHHLKAIGVDKVKISVDSIDADEYAKTRRQGKTLSTAIDALFHAKEAGLQAGVLTVCTHENAQTEQTRKLAAFCHEHGFHMDIMIARAVGAWEGKEEILITPDDNKFFRQLSLEYPEAHRDTFPTYGETVGTCGCVDKILHLTKYGDILPCVFIHIAIGNIFEESLADIIKRGKSIRHFVNPGPLCLSGEHRGFIRKYMSKFYGKPLPIHWSEAFDADDFIA